MRGAGWVRPWVQVRERAVSAPTPEPGSALPEVLETLSFNGSAFVFLRTKDGWFAGPQETPKAFDDLVDERDALKEAALVLHNFIGNKHPDMAKLEPEVQEAILTVRKVALS